MVVELNSINQRDMASSDAENGNLFDSFGILGCGKMARAIVEGMMEAKVIAADRVYCAVKTEESAENLDKYYSGRFGGVGFGDEGCLDVCRNSGVVLLAVKPYMAKSVLLETPGLKKELRGKLLISVLSGVKAKQLSEWLPETTIIRAMPNTPCKIRFGMTALAVGSKKPSLHEKNIAFKIFSTIGRARYIDEKHMDAATALCGSAPALGCVMLESLADGGVLKGLPRDMALEMAAQSMLGAAQMVLQTKKHPAQLKDEITTPAGCTIAGLMALEDGNVRSTIARAVETATIAAGQQGSTQDSKK